MKIFQRVLLLVAFPVLLLTSCPSPFGFYPNEDDRYSSTETGETAPPGVVATPYFMSRPLGSNAEYTVINGDTANFPSDQEVIIKSETENASFLYTTNESTPSLGSAQSIVFSNPIAVQGSNASKIIIAIGLKSLYYPSITNEVTVNIFPSQVATPGFNLVSGSYQGTQTLVLSSTPSEAKIWYELTTDGSTPSDPVSGTSTQYTSPITLSNEGITYKVKAFASLNNFTDSSISTGSFTILSRYSVSYNANGANSGSVPTDSNLYYAAESISVAGNSGFLVRDGYSFGGWNTSPEGNGVQYGGTSSMPNNNLTLYAVWIPGYEFFTFNGNSSNTMGSNATWNLTNVDFDADSMLLDGVYANSGTADAENVYLSIPSFDRSSFSVALSVNIPQGSSSAGTIPIVIGGRSYRWMKLLLTGNQLSLTVESGTSAPYTSTNYTISTPFTDDGNYHDFYLTVDSDSGTIAFGLDNNSIETFNLPGGFSFLTPYSGIDQGFYLQDYSSGTALVGDVDWMFVSFEAMPRTQIQSYAVD